MNWIYFSTNKQTW